MQLTITGKQVDIGDRLRRHVEAGIEAILAKYFKTAVEAHVVMAREAHLIRAEISVHIGRGIVVNAGAAADDADAAFDAASERAAKRLRRQKRRMRDHHAGPLDPRGLEDGAGNAPAAPVPEDPEEGVAADEPAVVAEAGGEQVRLAVG